MQELKDTIVAISTPPGKAGIGIVRLSGPNALAIADNVFLPKTKTRPLSFKTHSVHYGWIVSRLQKTSKKVSAINYGLETEMIDEVLLTLMRAPKTYTRQDIVEISCHSGVAVLRKILDLVIKNGARIAEPGEFTKRAFLNGRIDLAQAEAVFDIINSQTELSLNAAIRQLSGGLSKKVSFIRNKLLDLLSQIEASIDFFCEDIQTIRPEALKKRLIAIKNQIHRLLKNIDAGIILRDGITVVIWGRPNVGKSSLMNALLEKERVIVTPIAGTTRDSIEETIYIKGIPVRLVDAAGIIEPKGLMEKMSVDKAQQCLKNAGLILFVIDGSQLLKKEDYLAAQHIKGKDYIAVVNKSDLPQRIRLDEVKAIVNDCTKIVSISATKNIGIGALKKHIFDFIWAGKTVDASDIVVTNARHKIALEEANKNLTGAVESLKLEFSYEFIAADVKDAINSLANITGQAVGDEVLDRIFSKFCIGK